MGRRHIDAWMDGVLLQSIGPVLISDVNEPGPDMEITYVNRPGGGQIVSRRSRKCLRVTIQCVIHELWDLARRNQVRQEIVRWAQGSVLKLSNHPGQHLKVICKNEPGTGDDRDYNSEIQLEFEANEIPYWENDLPVSGSGSGNSGTVSLFVPGSCDKTPILATITPGSGNTITSLVLTVTNGSKSRSIELTGVSTAGAITFDRDEFDRLNISIPSQSLLPYRTQASDDDLTVPAGTVTCEWEANCSVTADFSAYGRWL